MSQKEHFMVRKQRSGDVKPVAAFTDIPSLKAYLSTLPRNSKFSPYTISLNVTYSPDFYSAGLVDYSRHHVHLDLSGSTFTSVGNAAFFDCHMLTGVTLPNNVTSIGQEAFCYCENLRKINIPNGVTSIGDRVFFHCDALTSITIPNSVTNIGENAFSSCDSLTSINIPDNLVSIGECAFDWADLTGSVSIPNSVTSIGAAAFANCSNLIAINVAADNPAYTSENGVLYNKDKTELIVYPAGKTDPFFTIPDSVTFIRESAFSLNKAITGVKIPCGVTSIGESAFSNCEKLASINIPDGITNLEYWTFARTALTSITIPDSVASIGECVFLECKELTNVIFNRDTLTFYLSPGEPVFDGDLKGKYHAGGKGTYTRPKEGEEWKKQK
jgi:hypothetical protein